MLDQGLVPLTRPQVDWNRGYEESSLQRENELRRMYRRLKRYFLRRSPKSSSGARTRSLWKSHWREVTVVFGSARLHRFTNSAAPEEVMALLKTITERWESSSSSFRERWNDLPETE
jgi:hypothetical protein